MKRGGVIVILLVSLSLIYANSSITIVYPNVTVGTNIPFLNITLEKPSNVTYSWDDEANISGCRNCTSYNTSYGEILTEANTSLLLHFNENFGSVVFDDSGEGNNGILGDTAIGDAAEPSWVAGRFGSALDFYCSNCQLNGEGDYVNIPHSDSLTMDKGLTILTWIKPREMGAGWHAFIEKINDDYGLYLLNRFAVLYVYNTNDLTAEVRGTPQLNTGEWYCIAGTYDGTFAKIFVNGQLENLEPLTGSIRNSGGLLEIGGNGVIDGYFNGTIDEVSIYNRALNETEISGACYKTLEDGPHNVTVHALNETGDLSSDTRYFTVDTQEPYKIDLNSPANGSVISSNVKFNWTAYDQLSNMSSSLTVNDSVINASIPTYNSTPTTYNITLSDGLHNWSITTLDDAGNANSSITVHFTVDSAPPTYNPSLFNNTPLTPDDDENVTCYSYWTDNNGLDHAIVEENATGQNHTILLSGNAGWANHTIDASDLEAGSVQCRIYVYDEAGNVNSTPVWTFQARDTSPPAITDISYSPNTADGLDPNLTINVSANITDFTQEDTVILQYREVGTWTNLTMSLSSGLYQGNFTPNTINNWSFRIWANDTDGNSNFSDVTTLSIDYDWTWTSSPGSLGTLNGRVGTEISLGNMTINNTGDFDLNFTLTPSPLWISFDGNAGITSLFLANGTSNTLQINATPSDSFEASYTITMTIDAVQENATPSSLSTNATLITYKSGPLLKVNIDTEISSVTQGGTGINLTATVINAGNDSAIDAWLAWALTSGWSNTSGVLNKSSIFLNSISLGSKFSTSNLIMVDISASAAAGTQTLMAIAGCPNCTETGLSNASKNVVVISLSTPTTSTGRGSPPPVLSSPTYSPSEAEKDEVFPSVAPLEMIRGTNRTVVVNVTNPFENSTLENVSLQVTGYPAERLVIEPSTLSSIDFGDTKEFLVTVVVPSTEGTVYNLDLVLSGKVLYRDYPTEKSQSGRVLKRENHSVEFTESRAMTLIIQGEEPPTYSPTFEDVESLFQVPTSLELVRGSDVEFPVVVTNPYPDSILEVLVLTVSGYPRENTEIIPSSITGVGYKETEEFSVKVSAPSYLEKGTYQLSVSLSGKVHYPDYPTAISDLTGAPLIVRDISLDMTESRTIPLDLYTTSRGDAMATLELAAGTINSLKELGFTTNRVTRLLKQALLAFDNKDYEDAKLLADEVIGTKGIAISARELLKDVATAINSAEDERGLRIVDAKKLYSLALVAFEREDYFTALERLEDAQSVLALETKGKMNWVKLLLDYWYVTVLGAFGIIGGSLLTYQRVQTSWIKRRLEDLGVEEENISGLIQQAQTKYYVDDAMSRGDYKSTLESLEDRLREINEARAGLISKRTGRIGIHEEMEELREETMHLTDLMKQVQERYFENRAMHPREYERAMNGFKIRRAMLEEKMAMSEAKLEKKRRGR